MSWVVILVLGFVTVITLVLGFLAIIQRRRDPIAWSFAISMVACAGWSGGIALFYASQLASVTDWAVRIYYISAALIALSILYLSLSIARKTHKIHHYIYVVATVPFLAIMAGILFSPEVLIRYSQPGSVTLNLSGYFVYVVYFIIYYVSALLLFASSVRRSRGMVKARYNYLLIGFTIGGAIGMTFNLILPAIGNYEYIWAGPLGLFIFVPMVYVTIVKYGLFDIRQALARTIAYISTLSVIGIVYALPVTFLSNVLASNVIAQTLIILAAALSFQPVKSFFDNLTDTLFYKNTYHAGDFYTHFNERLTSTTELRVLLQRTSELIKKTLKTQQASLFVYIDEEQYMTAGTDGYIKFPYADATLLGSCTDDLIIVDSPDVSPEIHKMLMSHKIALIMRLRTGDAVMGYLILGNHLTSHFSNRDIKVLETIANSLAIAIQNAVSVHEVQELNDTLQQRVSNATSELRRSNAQLQRLDESKDEFISMASHQLRTPLTSIKGYISMLLEGDVGKVTEDQKHILNEVFLSSERMVRLIGDFLNVSRLQTGKFVIEKHPIDLALLVQREIDGLAQNSSTRGVKFMYKMPKDIPILQLDENKIQQVVMNFSDNAMYYSKEKSKITVSLKKIPGYVEFKVIDTGIGVPESEQLHLFNKFFRATNARRARPDGTGVGLFLAKKVIDEHGGEIIFESKEGKGSTFGFLLPLPKE